VAFDRTDHSHEKGKGGLGNERKNHTFYARKIRSLWGGRTYKVPYGLRFDPDLYLISVHRKEYRTGLLSDGLVGHHLLLLPADFKKCNKMLCPESGIHFPYKRNPQLLPEADFLTAAAKGVPHIQMPGM